MIDQLCPPHNKKVTENDKFCVYYPCLWLINLKLTKQNVTIT